MLAVHAGNQNYLSCPDNPGRIEEQHRAFSLITDALAWITRITEPQFEANEASNAAGNSL